ncbi:MAG: sporulation integral membrane protein YlbJ [Halanaerobiaceae bacterium]
MNRKKIKTEGKIILISLISVITTFMIVIYSEAAFDAALEGLNVWWEIVFPSLLPFFIIAEILMGIGVVHFLGALMEPLMRPLFKVPGVGAFAFSMGLASGYPIGAKITSNLRRKDLCSQTEAERLVSFCNTADPLFMIGAVSVGMFHRPELGVIIAGAHYISSILIGLIMRFYHGNENKIYTGYRTRIKNKNIFLHAYNELITARRNDGRPLGKLLGDSIMEGINTLLMIGGFIILFSVITRMISVTGLINYVSLLLNHLLQVLGLSRTTILPLVSGFFEITNGANLASQARAPLLEQLVVVNAVIAWSGLSVHAQVATMIHGTDIRLKPYILARILQSLLAGITTLIIFIPFNRSVQSVSLPLVEEVTGFRNFLLLILGTLTGLILTILILSLIIHYLRKIKIVFFNLRS